MRESHLTTVLSILWAAQAGAQVPVVDSAALPPAVRDSVAAPSPREAVLEGREVVERRDWSAGSVRRMGHDELVRAGSLGQALSREPGVLVRQSGGLGSWTQMEVRGAPASQTEVYLDGVPMGGSAGSSVDLGPVPVEGLEWAELRQAGDDGADGAPRLDLRSRAGWNRLGASVRQGSFGEQGISAFGGDPSGTISASAWWERARNDYPFRWDNGTIYNAADDRIVRLGNNDYRGFGAAAGLRPGESVQMSVRWDSTERGVTSPSNPDPAARFGKSALQATASWDWDGGFRQHGEAWGKWHSSRWRDPSQSADYAVAQGMDEVGRDFGLRGTVERADSGWILPGVEIRSRYESSERSTTGGVTANPDGRRLSISGATSLRWGPPQGEYGLEVRAGGGWIRDSRNFNEQMSIQRNGQPLELEWRPIEGRMRIWYAPAPSWSLWISGEGARRIPDFREWMGDNGFVMANPNLGPELSKGAEAGALLRAGDWKAKTAAWVRSYEGPISLVSRGAGPLGIYQNGPDDRFLGVDGEVSYSAGMCWIRATGTLQDARQSDPNPVLDGKRPRWTPAEKGHAEIGVAPFAWLETAYTLDARGEVYADEFNDPGSERPGQILHGIWISSSWSSLRLTLAVANLTDEPARDWEYLPLAGRRFVARLDWNLKPDPPIQGSKR